MELKREELKQATKEDTVEEVMEDQAQEGGQAMLTEDAGKEEGILQTYYEHLNPTEIEAFRAFEMVCVQNKYLTREIILLEEQNITLHSINRRLEHLLRLKCEAPTSSSPSSLKKET